MSSIKLDNLDYLRGLMITDRYSSSKRNDILNREINPLFKDEPLTEEVIEELYSKDSRLSVLDEKFLKENGNAYQIGVSLVSKFRVLKNMSNYIGKGDALIEALLYNAECKNIDEVVKIVKGIPVLEMGDNDVELSKRI